MSNLNLTESVISSHEWMRGSTNEYCKHCGLIFESDLGWTSADGMKCVDRKINFADKRQWLELLSSYCKFHSIYYDVKTERFVKPYSDICMTVSEIETKINELLFKKNEQIDLVCV